MTLYANFCTPRVNLITVVTGDHAVWETRRIYNTLYVETLSNAHLAPTMHMTSL